MPPDVIARVRYYEVEAAKRAFSGSGQKDDYLGYMEYDTDISFTDDDDLVFSNEEGHLRTYYGTRAMLDKLMKKAGFDEYGFHFHTLRVRKRYGNVIYTGGCQTAAVLFFNLCNDFYKIYFPKLKIYQVRKIEKSYISHAKAKFKFDFFYHYFTTIGAETDSFRAFQTVFSGYGNSA